MRVIGVCDLDLGFGLVLGTNLQGNQGTRKATKGRPFYQSQAKIIQSSFQLCFIQKQDRRLRDNFLFFVTRAILLALHQCIGSNLGCARRYHDIFGHPLEILD